MAQGLFDDLIPQDQGAGKFAAPQLASVAAVNPAGDLFTDLIPAPDGVAEVRANVGKMIDRSRDTNRSLGAGIVRSGVGVASLPGTLEQLGRMGYNWANRQLGGQTQVSPQPEVMNRVYQATGLPGSTFADVKGTVERNVTGPLYEPKTTAGEYARTVGEFVPGLAFGGGGLAQRAISNVVVPALASETAGQATKGTSAEPYARAAGGIAGTVLPQVAGRMISPGALNVQTPKAAERARQVGVMQAEGVPLTAGDLTGSKSMRWFERVAEDTPIAAGRAAQVRGDQAEAFTRRVLSRAGINAPLATQDVIDSGFARLGAEFDRIAAAAKIVPGAWSPQTKNAIVSSINKVESAYADMMPPNGAAVGITRLSDGLRQAVASGGQVTGEQYQSWRSVLDKMRRASNPADPFHDAIVGLQGVLDDMVQATWKHAPPKARAFGAQLAQDYTKARREYRNLLAIERAATGAGEEAAQGVISPQALRTAVKVVHGERNYSRGRGDFGDFARSGAAVIAPLPNSGTPAREAVGALFGAAGAAAAGPPGVLAALAPAAGRAFGGRMIFNPTVQAYLKNQAGAGLVNLPRGSPVAGVLGGYTGGQN